MLTNLKYIYLRKQEVEKSLSVVERILVLFPEATSELRDRGLLYYQLGYYPQATNDLENYLANVPNAEDAATIRRLLGEIK
jgi:regulator of sirC expression with transglutaminase-like and TPR domain